jgi:hypothetical protein
MQADAPAGKLRFGSGLAHVLLTDLLGPLGDLNGRLVSIDVDERPAQTGQLARTKSTEEPRQPHRRISVIRNGIEEDPSSLLDREGLALLGRTGLGQENILDRVGPDPLLAERMTAGLVEVIPCVVDRADRVGGFVHAGKDSLDPVGSGPVDPQHPYRRPDMGRQESPGIVDVLSAFCLAWRVRPPGAPLGHPASSHASGTSLYDANRWRLGTGSPPAARRASSSLRSASALAFSTRSTFRREPSGNRTQAIHRCFDSFHLNVARGATPQPPGAENGRRQPHEGNHTKGYAESGYVGWTHKEILARNDF